MTKITIKGADTMTWHDKLYPITDKYRSAMRYKPYPSRAGSRDKTKNQLVTLNILIDGDNCRISLPRNHFRKVVVDHQNHIQISKVLYDQNKSKFKHKEQKDHTITLDRFIKTSKEGN